jgi:hypothetical protein
MGLNHELLVDGRVVPLDTTNAITCNAAPLPQNSSGTIPTLLTNAFDQTARTNGINNSTLTEFCT